MAIGCWVGYANGMVRMGAKWDKAINYAKGIFALGQGLCFGINHS
jgi:hypothetical protein